MSIRVEWKGTVLRLLKSKEDAERLGIELGRGHLERFQPVEHESGFGWLTKDRQSGRLYDDVGPIN